MQRMFDLAKQAINGGGSARYETIAFMLAETVLGNRTHEQTCDELAAMICDDEESIRTFKEHQERTQKNMKREFEGFIKGKVS